MPDTSQRFTLERREAFLRALEGGMTQVEACESLKVSQSTIRKWLGRGRKAESGEAFDFAVAHDAIVKAPRKPVPAALVAETVRGGLSEADLVRLLEEAAVGGNVQAMKYLLERPWERKDNGDEGKEAQGASIFDELAALRERKTAG